MRVSRMCSLCISNYLVVLVLQHPCCYHSLKYCHFYLVRWYAGASVEFETNKGRIMRFNPYFKTGLKDHEVTLIAKDGMEIIMLNIK